MELNELKNVWQKEKSDLENRIKLNERWIRELSFDKSKGAFDKFVSTAILGRYLALVYGVISFSIAILLFQLLHEYEYGALAFAGGVPMIFSFFQHQSVKKIDFSKTSTIELQKTIYQFRVHIVKHWKHDIAIVCIWMFTLMTSLAPMVLILFKNQISIVLLFCVVFLQIVWFLSRSKKIYYKWNKELKELEIQLSQIIEFENS